MSDTPMENAELYQRDKMAPSEVYYLERALEVEKDINEHLDPYARFTESMFRRQALPILSGLIDDTFNQANYISCIGSAFVPLQVVDDVDNSKLLFTIPALMFTGDTLMHVEGQQSLTDEAMEIQQYAEIVPSIGEQAKHDMIMGVLDGIDQLTYERNRRRAKQTIDILNWVFERYKVNGRIAYPAGMEDLLNEPAAAVPAKAQAVTTVEVSDGGIEDGEDL